MALPPISFVELLLRFRQTERVHRISATEIRVALHPSCEIVAPRPVRFLTARQRTGDVLTPEVLLPVGIDEFVGTDRVERLRHRQKAVVVPVPARAFELTGVDMETLRATSVDPAPSPKKIHCYFARICSDRLEEWEREKYGDTPFSGIKVATDSIQAD